MSLVEEIHAQFTEVGNQVHHVLSMTAQSEVDFEEAWFGLRNLRPEPGTQLYDAVAQLEVAYAALAEARTILSSYPDIVNSYLGRLGVDQLSTRPPIPEQAPPPAREAIPRKKPGPKRKTPPVIEPTEPPLDRFDTIGPHMDRLTMIRDQLNAGRPPKTINGYIGSGDKYHVFDNGDGTWLKIPKDDQSPHILPDYERNLAEIVKDRACFEQILGLTTEQGGALLVRSIPGKSLENMTDSELMSEVSPKQRAMHFTALARAIGFIVRQGLSVEYRSAGTFYTPTQGFVLVDNAIGNTPSDSQEAIDTEARMALVMFGLGEADQKTRSIQEFKRLYLRAYPNSRLRYDWDWRDLGT